MTALCAITVCFLFADQNLMAPNLSLIADSFGFDDQQRDDKLGADIAVGFFCIGGPIALIAGYYADVVNRCILFGIVVILGSIASGSCTFVQTYNQLYTARVLTGISIGGATPIVFSLLADLYPVSKRIKMAMYIGIAMAAGISFGQVLATHISPSLLDHSSCSS